MLPPGTLPDSVDFRGVPLSARTGSSLGLFGGSAALCVTHQQDQNKLGQLRQIQPTSLLRKAHGLFPVKLQGGKGTLSQSTFPTSIPILWEMQNKNKSNLEV